MSIENREAPLWVLLHGWGSNASVMGGLRAQLGRSAEVWAPNLPGFGGTAPPVGTWGVDDYVDWVMQQPPMGGERPVILVGHSFGGRIALKLSAAYPQKVQALVLIASAGIRLPKPWWRRIWIASVQRSARLCKALLPGSWGEWLKRLLLKRIASADYLNAGELRGTLIRVIQEDLANIARQVKAPALLLYGSEDRETPTLIGQKLAACLAGAQLYELEGFDHYSILSQGVFQVVHRVQKFIRMVVVR